MNKFRKIPGMSWGASIKYFLSAQCAACAFVRSMIELALIVSNVLLAFVILFYIYVELVIKAI